MGLESAERRLLEALRSSADGVTPDLRVVGGRAARRYGRAVGGRWCPALPGGLPRRAWRSADVVHLLGLDLPPPPRGPFVLTVYDLAPLRFSDEGALPHWTAESTARAERILTPSAFTAGELEQLLGVPRQKLRVIPIGPGLSVSPDTAPLAAPELASRGLDSPLVLRMGGYTERKNVAALLAAWPEVHRQTGACLALVGPAQPARDLQLASAPSLEGVVVLDYLPSSVLPRLLRAATALVSTSTYEGFGLPPLEAMAAGVPVVAVRSEFAAEVCGEAAVLVGNEPQAIAHELARVLGDGGLRDRLRDAGLRRSASFSWSGAAADVLAVYREVATLR